MGDDIVEHLSTVDILKEHIPVVVRAHHITKSADIRVIKQGDDRSLSSRADFFGLVCSFFVGAAVMVLLCRASRDDLAGDLREGLFSKGETGNCEEQHC